MRARLRRSWSACVAGLLFLLASACAHAAPGRAPTAAARTPVLEALAAELARNQASLKLPDAPPLYHLRYHLTDIQSVYVRASFGGVVTQKQEPDRRLGVEVRVGSPAFDSTGFGGWETGFSSRTLGVGPSPHADRLVAWQATDSAYKDAVEQFSRKEAAYTPAADHPGDFQVRPATVATGSLPAPPDAERLGGLARRLSAELQAFRRLERGEVEVGGEMGFHWIADTDGTRVLRPHTEVSFAAVAAARAADGMLVADRALWIARRAAGLPDYASMAAEVRALGTRLEALSQAPVLADEYVGPVIFEGSAAPDFFRHLLLPQLEGTPPPVSFDRMLGRGGAGGERDGKVRLKRRVLPPAAGTAPALW